MALSLLGALIVGSVNYVYKTKRIDALGSSCDLQARLLQKQFMFHVDQLQDIGTLVTRFYHSKNALDSKKMQEHLASYINSTAHLHPFFKEIVYGERVFKNERLKFERRHGWMIKAFEDDQDNHPRCAPAPIIFGCGGYLGDLISVDMMSDTEERENVIKARDTGSISLSSPWMLVGSDVMAFGLIYPVYRTDLLDRIRATTGYIAALFAFESFSENILVEPNDTNSQTIIYDVTNSSDSLLLYDDYYGEDQMSFSHVSHLELSDSARTHKMICGYVTKPLYSRAAVVSTLLFLMFTFFLGCILFVGAIYIEKIREASQS